MHTWGDETFDWDSLSLATEYVYSYCRRWGRLGGQAKEKFGTLRFYAMFGNMSLHTLLYPGYVCSKFPGWLWHLDCRYIRPFFEATKLSVAFCWWQSKVYSRAYVNACKKWPHIQGEILSDMDCPKLLPKKMWVVKDNHLIISDISGKTVSTWIIYV